MFPFNHPFFLKRDHSMSLPPSSIDCTTATKECLGFAKAFADFGEFADLVPRTRCHASHQVLHASGR